MLKKALSLFLSLVIVFSMLSVTAITANAKETSMVSTEPTTEDVKISGTNSLGNMLADEYSENVDEEELIGNNIYEIEVENSTVYVDLQALTNAKLVVALYDESTQEMLCTGMKDISTDDTVVQVELDVDAMPQYFVIKAYMLDAETNVPLCKHFECDTYTQTMQEFLSKTTEDFEQEKVLTLDEQNDNNFLVYNDETVRTEGNENTNVVTVTDETAQKYVIENIDESISSLQAGDIFSHTYGDEENILIIKVSSITIDGTTATIYGEEVELEEAFDFIKIDASQGTSETTVDNTELEDGVEFLGVEEEDPSVSGKDPSSVGATLVDKEFTAGTSLKYELDKKIGPCKISGGIGCKFEAKLKCYYDAKLFKKDDVEFSFAIKYEASIGVGIELATDDDSEIKVKLGALGFSPIPGVYIDFTPSIIVEGKVSVELNGTLSGQVGKKFKNGKFSDNGKKAKFDAEFKVSGELFIGFSMEPKIGVVGDIITASAEAKTGVKISAEMKYSTESDVNDDEKHLCKSCVDGDITWHTELSFELKLLDSKNLTWKATAFTLDKKLCNFYYSFDTNKFAFTSCPNNTYKQTITIVNMDNGFQVVEGADVNGVKTDKNGIAVLYFTKGTHNVVIKKDSIVLNKSIDVKKSDEHSFILDSANSTSVSGSVVDSLKPTETETGQCGDNVYYTLYADGTLVISGYGDMYDYYLFDSPFSNDNIKTAKIQNGITNIGAYAFYHCTSLTSITISNSVTSIGDDAFYHCTSLTSITIPDSVTSIGDRAFYNCTSLTSITIPDSVTSIGDAAFGDCTNLTSITIPDSVTSIGDSTFKYCTSLTSITIPNSVTSIGDYAFSYCTNLTNITIPDSVTSIGEYTFYNTDYYNNTNNWENGILYIGNHLIRAKTSIVGEYVIKNDVISIADYAFHNCTSLTSITIPDNLTSIGSFVFEHCTNLTNITIPNSVTSIGNEAFSGCKSLTSITIPNSVTSIGYSAFYNTGYYNNTNNWENGILYIGNHLIRAKTSIVGEYVIKNDVISIADYAFHNCTNLTNITIPDSVTSIGYTAFYDCSSLTNITIPDSVTSIGAYAFCNCTSLTSITIPDSVTSIGYSAFYNTGYYNNTNNWKNGILYIGNHLIRATTSIVGEYVIKNDVISIADSAFYNCDSLTSITIPYSVTSIGYQAFYKCSNLTNVYYTGTEEQWNQIYIDSFNICLTSATIYYNSSANAVSSVGNNLIQATPNSQEVSTNSTETTTIKEYTRTNLAPNTEAVLMIAQGTAEDYEISTSTLIYITQTTVDESGTATFITYGDFTDNSWSVVLIFGECTHSSSKWETVKEATYTETGLEVCICDHCGEAIESKEIDVLVPEYPLGDANNDNVVNILDATHIQKYLVGMITLTESQKQNADVNKDGVVSILDATEIQKHLVGKSSF